ncbi:hypothetical protein [Lentzea nigeriaca]|uniref:hypothetical protein n=1 Tax=Lentzea nigeriaca TaxID=1128665 RepID=UPI00195641B3|nr:hypothetical protein [Lentzea nigeriaca]MBM7864996.1 hypothetical protein [Lentzea nigeriaca]
MVWQSADGVSIHYVIDATAGIGYVTLAGPDEVTVGRFVSEAVNALSPWTLEQLFREFDRSEDVVERGRLTLRIGLAAPAASNTGCLQRIQQSLTHVDPRIRLAAVWAASYTGYSEFTSLVRDTAESDPEEWLRVRAASVVDAFEAANPHGPDAS